MKAPRPVSRASICKTSSSSSEKSNSSRFCLMRSSWQDLASTTIPRSISQRKTTWAGVFPWRSAIARIRGFPRTPRRSGAERGPCLVLDAGGGHQVVGSELLAQRVRLDLVHVGRHAAEGTQVGQAHGQEVARPDRADLALLIKADEVPPRAAVVGEGLVQQDEVEVVGLEPHERPLDGAVGLALAVTPDPDLGRQELVGAVDRRGLDGIPHLLHVEIALGGVEMAVADADGLVDNPSALVGGDAVPPKPTLGIATPLERTTFSMRRPPSRYLMILFAGEASAARLQ